jgi:flagellar biosynthesis/type III secretory pathway protein FliH
MLCGTSKDNPRYDLISVILVNLSKDHDCGDTDNELLRFLTDLFDDEMDVREKLNILQNKYHLPLTAEIEKEVSEMCSYTASVLERGLDQGRAEGRTEGLAEGRAESIGRLLRKGKTPEEVHELLDYPMKEILRVEREVLSAVK